MRGEDYKFSPWRRLIAGHTQARIKDPRVQGALRVLTRLSELEDCTASDAEERRKYSGVTRDRAIVELVKNFRARIRCGPAGTGRACALTGKYRFVSS